MPKLKVYCTSIGFHDAYVAAASQKAALQAWGSEADLFARGIAEVVTDEALSAEPLASPGKVIRRLRGTAEEQLAMKLPERPNGPSRDNEGEEPAPKRRSARVRKPAAPKGPPPPPRPDRAELEAAEKAVEDAKARQDREDGELRKRREALEQERRQLDHAHEEEQQHLAEDEDRARRAYDAALRAWKAAAPR